jgi:hypothetical protein
MARVDPTIQLPEFCGEGLEDPEKNLFICENIWVAKQITNEDKKSGTVGNHIQRPHTRLVYGPCNKEYTRITYNYWRCEEVIDQ